MFPEPESFDPVIPFYNTLMEGVAYRTGVECLACVPLFFYARKASELV